jgi:hypothetical protein
MHRFAAVLLSASLVLGAAACSDDDSDDESSDTSSAPQTTAERPTENTFDAGENQAFCDQYEVLGDALIDANGGEGDVEEAIATVQEAYAEALDLAPDDIAEPMAVVNDNVQASEDLAEMILVSGDVMTASDEVNTWVTDNCGFDPTQVLN